MYARKSSRKAKSGSVQVKISNNRLQLVFSHGGKRHYFSTGLTDSPLHRKLAQDKAFQIQRDIEYGEFDSTLEKYKPQLALTTVEPVSTIATALTMAEVWSRYVEIRQVGKSPSTLRMYDWVSNHIDRCPHTLPTEAQAIFDWMAVNIVPGTVKRLLTQFCSCCRWAKKAGLIESNPFVGMAAEVKEPVTEDDEDVDPFSRQERDDVIAAFKASRYYKHYAPLVEFLFFTGCRPSEALALEWRHISSAVIQFEQALVNGRKRKLVVKKGLKTQERRKFPINSQVAKILESIKPTHCVPNSLVFPSPKGKHIDWHNFTNRGWKLTLESLPEIEHRKPYQTRHTFCSLCREEGAASIQIAKWVGNSAEMIDRVYAKPVDQVQVPIL